MTPHEQAVHAALSAVDTLATMARQSAREWIPAEVRDGPEEDARPNVPPDSREVLVFLCGNVDIGDEKGRNGGGWGVRLGYCDNGIWRVHGRAEHHVTHWMELPAPPTPGKWPPVLGGAS